MVKRSLRQVAASLATLLGIVACVPDTPTPPTPAPVQKPAVTPQSGGGGTVVTIAAPDRQCDPTANGSTTQLIAGLSSPASGAVAAYSWQYAWDSGSAAVTVTVPESASPGVYNVFLACQTPNGSYAFTPATFTVTPSGSPAPGGSPARPVASPASGPAGTSVTIAAPGGECDPPAGGVPTPQLIGGIAIQRSGETVAYSWAYPSNGSSANVRVRIPKYTAPGTYNVFLACLAESGSYAFAPATFTVTAP